MWKTVLIAVISAAVSAVIVVLVLSPRTDQPAKKPSVLPVVGPLRTVQHLGSAERVKGQENAIVPTRPDTDQSNQTESTAASLEDEYKGIMAYLEASGPSDEDWTETAKVLLQQWRSSAPSWVRDLASSADTRCYSTGCVLNVRYRSKEQARQAADEIGSTLDGWLGARIYLAVDDRDPDHVYSSFVLLRPEAEQ